VVVWFQSPIDATRSSRDKDIYMGLFLVTPALSVNYVLVL
jgi:hypothetical protein